MMSNRPVFRGNKGIQDGQIPRSKKKKSAKKPEQNKYINEDSVCNADHVNSDKEALDMVSMEHTSTEGDANANICFC